MEVILTIVAILFLAYMAECMLFTGYLLCRFYYPQYMSSSPEGAEQMKRFSTMVRNKPILSQLLFWFTSIARYPLNFWGRYYYKVAIAVNLWYGEKLRGQQFNYD